MLRAGGLLLGPLIRIIAVVDAAKYNPNNPSSGGVMLAACAAIGVPAVAVIGLGVALAGFGAVAVAVNDDMTALQAELEAETKAVQIIQKEAAEVQASTQPDPSLGEIPVETEPPQTSEAASEPAPTVDEEARLREVRERAKREVEEAREYARREIEAAKTRKAGAKTAAEKAAEFRTWTSTAGTEIEARFAGKIGQTVTLEKRDGSTIKVPLDKLSKDDQAFVAAKAKK